MIGELSYPTVINWLVHRQNRIYLFYCLSCSTDVMYFYSGRSWIRKHDRIVLLYPSLPLTPISPLFIITITVTVIIKKWVLSIFPIIYMFDFCWSRNKLLHTITIVIIIFIVTTITISYHCIATIIIFIFIVTITTALLLLIPPLTPSSLLPPQ